MSLAPKLKKITVESDKLLLDPNNPRLFSNEETRTPLESYAERGVQDRTKSRLFPKDSKDRFRIDELIQSIKRNCYVPEAGGYIFVRRLPGTDNLVVLEGNRRLVAISELLSDEELLEQEFSAVLASIKKIDVYEIIDELPEEEIQKKISYLLGTCHHGSHKNWSPFARAKGIYERYMEVSSCTEEDFKYEKEHGETIAALLSIKPKEVLERLRVYRAMKKLADAPEMKEKENGGIIDSYYSLVKDAVASSSKSVKKYIPTNPDSFDPEPVAVERLINLCNFDGTRDRKSPRAPGLPEAPPAMTNPKQWGYLGKILDDEDNDKKELNLEAVESAQAKPEEVWARRHAELTRYTWKKWLEQVSGVLSVVSFGADFESPEAKSAINDIAEILDTLGEGCVQ
jgi:hypothetical protein